jgi:hypothetical protein
VFSGKSKYFLFKSLFFFSLYFRIISRRIMAKFLLFKLFFVNECTSKKLSGASVFENGSVPNIKNEGEWFCNATLGTLLTIRAAKVTTSYHVDLYCSENNRTSCVTYRFCISTNPWDWGNTALSCGAGCCKILTILQQPDPKD